MRREYDTLKDGLESILDRFQETYRENGYINDVILFGSDDRTLAGYDVAAEFSRFESAFFDSIIYDVYAVNLKKDKIYIGKLQIQNQLYDQKNIITFDYTDNKNGKRLSFFINVDFGSKIEGYWKKDENGNPLAIKRIYIKSLFDELVGVRN